MRIIAGLYKGRKLNPPSDRSVRPTPDRVKEALFSILGGHVENAVVLDLFAGSGNLGLEALSRGARKCYFADSSRDSIRLLHVNVAHCKADATSHIMQGDYRNALAQLREKVDLVFVDPPYGDGLWLDVLGILFDKKIMNPNGMIVLEHPREVEFPQEIYNFRKIKEGRYGTVVLSIYMC
jgi:16S rRNA (guanine(966)-N(2))-methyltransferase RsmD